MCCISVLPDSAFPCIQTRPSWYALSIPAPRVMTTRGKATLLIFWLHPLLGQVETRRVVGMPQNSQGPLQTSVKVNRSLVPREPASAVNEQQQGLVLKLGGHYQYYGITGNGRSLKRMRYQVCRVWHKWLCRRSQRAKLDWHRFNRLLMRYPLPQPRIFQSYTKCAANP